MGSPNVDIPVKELAPTPAVPGYVLVGPTGVRVPIPKEVFDAIDKFRREKSTGSIQLHFKSGGVAGVEAVQKHTFK